MLWIRVCSEVFRFGGNKIKQFPSHTLGQSKAKQKKSTKIARTKSEAEKIRFFKATKKIRNIQKHNLFLSQSGALNWKISLLIVMYSKTVKFSRIKRNYCAWSSTNLFNFSSRKFPWTNCGTESSKVSERNRVWEQCVKIVSGKFTGHFGTSLEKKANSNLNLRESNHDRDLIWADQNRPAAGQEHKVPVI
jgi:hypothetical protein